MTDVEATPVRIPGGERETIDKVLGTTRSVRRRLDPELPLDLGAVRRCLLAANQAPSAGSRQPLRWIAVSDPTVRAGVAAEYRRAYREFDLARPAAPDEATQRLRRSSATLADSLHTMPLLLLACSAAGLASPRTDASDAAFWASILPGVWSLQLGLRSDGIGSCLTTVGLSRARQILTAVEAPDTWQLCALLPVATMSGSTLSPARRLPAEETIRWI